MDLVLWGLGFRWLGVPLRVQSPPEGLDDLGSPLSRQNMGYRGI